MAFYKLAKPFAGCQGSLVAFLTAEGRSDVSTISARFPQHATVISRHLSQLHEAGVVRRSKQGRHVYFEMDGPGMADRMEKILERFRSIVPICCPTEAPKARLPAHHRKCFAAASTRC